MVTLVGAGAGYAWRSHQPSGYRAECVVQYGQDPQPPAATASEVSSREWQQTQDFLIASNSVAERVVQKLGLQRDHGFFLVSGKERLAKSQADAMATLRERIEVTRVEGTRLVRISVEDSSRKRAVRIANAIAENYLEKSIEDRAASTSRALEWLSAQMMQTSRQLDRAEGEMQSYLSRQNAPPIPIAERQEMLASEIKQLNTALTDARVRRIELAAVMAKLRAADRDNPFEIHTSEIDQNKHVERLQAEYAAFTSKHRETEIAQGDASQVVRSGESKLIVLRAQMRDAIDGIIRGAQAELTSAQSVESQLEALLAKRSLAGRELQTQELELRKLDRARRESEQMLKVLRERSTTAGIGNTIGEASAKIVEAARVSPHSPRYEAIGAAGLGAFIGLLLLALFNRFARSSAISPPGSAVTEERV